MRTTVKAILFVTMPVWALPALTFLFFKAAWEELSEWVDNWVEKRNRRAVKK